MKEQILTDSVLSLIPHQPPKGYEYKASSFKSNIVAVWLLCHRKFVYNGGAPTETIYAFYNTKTKRFHSPINSKTVGDVVDINSTTPYTSMPLKLNPLEYAFLHS
jgi:hypothetical protein